MTDRWQRSVPHVLVLSLGWAGLVAYPACSSDSATNAPAGSSATGTGLGGAAGAASTTASSGNGGATTVTGAGGMGATVTGVTVGSGGSGGAAGSGGGPGGSSAGAGGSAGGGGSAAGGSGGTAGGGGTAGAGGGGGGGKSCAGNAISLSANGTGTASDAAQARVEMNLMGDLPIGNASRTIEFWAYIKPTDWRGEVNEVYYYGTAGNAAAFGLDFGTNTVAGMPTNHATLNPITGGGFNDDSTADLGITSAMTQWVHIAMTWDGTAVRTYVNGAPKIATMGTGVTMLATGSSPLTMGCNPTNNNCFNGDLDEVRVWKVARTATQIMGAYNKTLVGDETDLVGYWKFDEAPGATMSADSVTTAGHTAHPAMLMATNANQRPTFITPTPPAPILCP